MPAPRLEAQLRRAAFGDCADLPIHLLARRCGRARERWLAAVVLGGQARYASAAALLHDLRDHPDPVLASLALSTLASHRRQLGGHRAARALDGAALAALAAAGSAERGTDPDGIDVLGARCDALLGLAADALGTPEMGTPGMGIAEARRILDLARSQGEHGWRTEVRTCWVCCEVELADGRPERAAPHAERAARRCVDVGAVRHGVKSDLVLAATLVTGTSETARAGELIDRARSMAARHQLLSLAWPAELLAGSVRGEGGEKVNDLLRRVLHRADPPGRLLAGDSAWMPLEQGIQSR
ncbi:MAG: hypothetical protein GEU98_14110 [Pseudonocardiaceae bacterium]|nr:hypothetical protein [Pseudonocardiaceae bacterium]